MLVFIPLSTFADDDRYIKGIAQADYMFYNGEGWNAGLGINFGNKYHLINFQTMVNYSMIGKISKNTNTNNTTNTSTTTNTNTGTETDKPYIEYTRISIPIEVHIRFISLNDDEKNFFVGVGAVYNYNMNGKIVAGNDKENTAKALTDGINAHNFAGRVSCGMTMGFNTISNIGLKAYADINITPPLNKYSVSDRLFEYGEEIEKALGLVTFGLSVFYTF